MTIKDYHIKLYKKFGGDVDHLQRLGTSGENTPENQNIMSVIRELTAELELVDKGLTSEEFRQKTETKLTELCASDEMVAQIRGLK